MKHPMERVEDADSNPRDFQPQQKDAVEQARDFENALRDCDRVIVEKKNALGEMDAEIFPGGVARLILPIT